jgi:teichuronic acid biosynthesis glycosyltransferase TuaC
MADTPPRVLAFTTLYPNREQPEHGVFVRERLRALAKLLEVEIMAPVPYAPPIRALGERYARYARIPRREQDRGVQVEHPRFLAIPKVGHPVAAPLMAQGVLATVRRQRRVFPFTLIDAHWAYPDGAAATIVARILRVPLALTVRGDDINVFLREACRGLWIRWALRQASVVIALSKGLRDAVIHAGTPATKIAVIPNGIDPDRFHPMTREAARAELGVPDAVPVLLSVGRLHHSKGYPVLVEAVGRLARELPNLQLIIAGAPDTEADARPSILATAAQYGITRRVHLVGPQRPVDLPYWYSAADLFCLPTAREGSANVLIEALACGVPCITTPVGGNPDLMTDPRLGRLVPATGPAMADAIRLSLAERWDRDWIAAYGRQRTWDVVAAECRDRLLAVVN